MFGNSSPASATSTDLTQLSERGRFRRSASFLDLGRLDAVLLCFVDESFKGDFYGFAGVLADEHATKDLTGRLNRIVAQAAVDFGIDRRTELHGYPMFHGREQWRTLGARARVSVLEKSIDAIVDSNVTILLRRVHARRLQERQAREHYPVNFPPEQVAFQHILQRAQRVAERDGTHVLMIADERGDRDRHRERFAMYQTMGTPGVYMHTTLSRLLDTVHFAPSHHSRMLQAADLLAFLYRRASTVQETDPRAEEAMDRLWGKVTSCGKIYDSGAWP